MIRTLIAGAIALAGSLGAAQAATVYDGSAYTDRASGRRAGDSPLGRYTFAQDFTLTGISQIADLERDGNVKFVVFEDSTRLFVSAALPFADIGRQSLAISGISVSVSPGSEYRIGAIADVDGQWSFGTFTSPDVQGDVTGLSNGNVENFDDPSLGIDAGALIAVSLDGEVPTPIPLPASLPLMLAGAGALAVLRGRRAAMPAG